MHMDKAVREQLAQIPTGNVADNNGGAPRQGVMDSGIKPLDPKSRMVGRAFTVGCRPGDNLAVHQALNAASEGDVLVLDCGGYTEAGHFGDITALACLMRGIAGVVIDGSCRDAEDIKELGLPVFVRGINPRGTTKAVLGELGVPVTCGGITVRTGDIVLGDCDGVVVVPREAEDEVFEAAQHKFEKELHQVEALRAGANTLELLGFDRIIAELEQK